MWLLCCDMALTYCEVKKAGVGFTPLRAVGLAVEEAHKLAKRTGTGKVTVEDLEEVRVTGDKVQVKEGKRWRKVARAVVGLRREEAVLALELFTQQRAELASEWLNIWLVDVSTKSRKGSHDLLGEFSYPEAPVAGKVSVELKAGAKTENNTKETQETKCSNQAPGASRQDSLSQVFSRRFSSVSVLSPARFLAKLGSKGKSLERRRTAKRGSWKTKLDLAWRGWCCWWRRSKEEGGGSGGRLGSRRNC